MAKSSMENHCFWNGHYITHGDSIASVGTSFTDTFKTALHRHSVSPPSPDGVTERVLTPPFWFMCQI